MNFTYTDFPENRQIGRNLYLHPVNCMAAVFKKDVRPWEGECTLPLSVLTLLTPFQAES
jgi:hypothetical protein